MLKIGERKGKLKGVREWVKIKDSCNIFEVFVVGWIKLYVKLYKGIYIIVIIKFLGRG